MNGGWRAWRKGTALHYRKNCLPLNVNRQAGEDGVCGGRFLFLSALSGERFQKAGNVQGESLCWPFGMNGR